MKIRNLKYSLAILGIATTVVLTGCGEKRKVQIGDSVIKYCEDEIKGSISYNELVRNIKVVTLEENNNLYYRLLVKDIKSNYKDLNFDSEAGTLVRYFDLKTDSCLMSYVDYHNGKVAYYIGENLNIVEEKDISSYLLKEDFVKTDYEVEEVIQFFNEKIEPSLSEDDKDRIPYEDVYGLHIYCASNKSASFHLNDQNDDEITTVLIDISEINNFLNKLPNVEHISIGLSGYTDGKFLNDFSKSEKVNRLDIIDCTEETCECISNFQNLESLSVWNCQLSDISSLSNLTNLNYLDLGNNSISDISSLSNLTNLKSLGLDYNSISDISPLSNLTNLENLNLACNSISDASCLSNLTDLKALRLDYNSTSDVSPLSNLTNLEILNLDYNSISDVSPLSNLTNLKLLRLDFNCISDVSPLSNLTNIYSLDLSINFISDISPLSHLTNLETLQLDYNSISDISPLSNLTKLGNLRLDYNSISDVSPLSNLTNLRTLNLEYNNISDISPLDGLEIKELDLYGNTHIVDSITFEQYNSNDDSNKEYSLK